MATRLTRRTRLLAMTLLAIIAGVSQFTRGATTAPRVPVSHHQTRLTPDKVHEARSRAREFLKRSIPPAVGDALDVSVASPSLDRVAVSGDEPRPAAQKGPDSDETKTLDWLEQSALANYGVMMPPTGCVDCDAAPYQVARLGSHDGILMGVSGGGGGGGVVVGSGGGVVGESGGGIGVGTGPSIQTLVSPITGTEDVPFGGVGSGAPSTPQGGRGGDEGGRGRGGNLPNGLPDSVVLPDPKALHTVLPPAVSVPEPSSFVMAGIGLAGFLAGRRFSRKQRG